MRSLRCAHAMLALAAVGALVLAGSASAVPAWRPSVPVEAMPSAAALSFPRVAARSGGCATVAFERSDTVFASTRAAGGSFSPLQNLGAVLPAPSPEIAAGGGVVAVAWPNPASRIQVATASGCDPLGSPAEVPGPYTLANVAAFPAVDGAGTTVVGFEANSGASRRIHVSERTAGGSSSNAIPLPAPMGTNAFRPRVATNASGAAGIVFDVVGAGTQVHGTLRTGPGTWAPPVPLNESGKPVLPNSARAALGPDGSLHAVWVDEDTSKLIFATLPPGGGAPTRTTLHEVAGGNIATDPPGPAIAVDSDGRIAVAWTQVVAGVRTVKAKMREPGGAFTGAIDVSPTTNEPRGNPLLAIDRQGRAVATWSSLTSIGAVQRTVAATRVPGAADFTEQETISNPAKFTSPSAISTDGDGNTLVALFMTESPREARVAAFDAAGPLLGALSVPSGLAGDALPFSLSALDAWSPPVATHWDFGDGTGADGDSVSHAYGSAGGLAVKATAADALGNASVADGTAWILPRVDPPDEPPRLARLRVVPAAFAAGARATIKFKLSERARIRFKVKPRGGSFKRNAKEGANRLRFTGRVGGRALAPGGYRLRAVAVDRAGNRSKPRTVRFTILAG